MVKTFDRLDPSIARNGKDLRSSKHGAHVGGLIARGQMIGWREWVSLPELGIERIKAKVDTGARTSSLHAVDIRPFERDGVEWVSFVAKPHTGGAMDRLEVPCEASVIGFRPVRSSSGFAEHRYFVMTPMVIGNKRFDIEVTLTNRAEMGFEMLFGRSALRRGRFVVHPSHSYLQGQVSRPAQRFEK